MTWVPAPKGESSFGEQRASGYAILTTIQELVRVPGWRNWQTQRT